MIIDEYEHARHPSTFEKCIQKIKEYKYSFYNESIRNLPKVHEGLIKRGK